MILLYRFFLLTVTIATAAVGKIPHLCEEHPDIAAAAAELRKETGNAVINPNGFTTEAEEPSRREPVSGRCLGDLFSWRDARNDKRLRGLR